MEQNKYMVSAVEVLRKAKEYLGQKDWTQVSKKEDWTVLKKKSFNISRLKYLSLYHLVIIYRILYKYIEN